MRILREPILHFVLLGALVFAAHQALRPDALDRHGIAVDAQKRSELAALFELRQHRTPSKAELDSLVERWVEDEVLFREGLALGLSQQDGAIRELMVAQMRALLQRSIDLPRPGQAQLKSFYDAHRADYAQPERISLSEYLIRPSARADDEARLLLRALQTEQPVEQVATTYHARSEAQLVQLYGELGRRIFALDTGKWHELRSTRGLHVVRLEARAPTSEPSFDALALQLQSDWRASEQRRRFEAEVARLRSRYDVRVEAHASARAPDTTQEVP